MHIQTETEGLKIVSIDMVRGSGYGQYSIIVHFTYEMVKYKKSFHTTDSELWDSEEKTSETLLNHIGGESRLLDTI
jgi:hypothetical protein